MRHGDEPLLLQIFPIQKKNGHHHLLQRCGDATWMVEGLGCVLVLCLVVSWWWSFVVVRCRVYACFCTTNAFSYNCTINHISNFENLVVSCVITIITKRTLDFCMCKAKIQRRSGCRVVTMGEWGMSCFRLCWSVLRALVSV